MNFGAHLFIIIYMVNQILKCQPTKSWILSLKPQKIMQSLRNNRPETKQNYTNLIAKVTQSIISTYLT